MELTKNIREITILDQKSRENADFMVLTSSGTGIMVLGANSRRTDRIIGSTNQDRPKDRHGL